MSPTVTQNGIIITQADAGH